MDSISDSEDDGGPLLVSDISRIRLKSNLDTLAHTDNQVLIERLRHSNYAPLLLSDDSVANCSSNNDPEVLQNTVVNLEPDEVETSDLHLLEMYVDNSHELRSRRSLRKRNFASTHPYLADQAHWLGLCSPNYLNDIYKDEQDVRKIVSFLNKLYTSKKQRYPKEDKYKAKSFYAHLGKAAQQYKLQVENDDSSGSFMPNSSQLKDDEEAEEEGEDEGVSYSQWDEDYTQVHNQKRITDDFDFEMPTSDEEQESNLTTPRSRPRNIVLDDEESSDSSVDRNDKENTQDEFILVGGRKRRIKLILRGVLPESAKRMNYFNSKLSMKKAKTREIQMRQGMAIRKPTKFKPRGNTADEFKDFIDNSPELLRIEEEGDIKEINSQYHSIAHLLHSYDSLEESETASYSLDSDASVIVIDEISNETLFEPEDNPTSDQNGDSSELFLHEIPYEVKESDYVNPIFSGSKSKTSGKLKSKRYKQKTLRSLVTNNRSITQPLFVHRAKPKRKISQRQAHFAALPKKNMDTSFSRPATLNERSLKSTGKRMKVKDITNLFTFVRPEEADRYYIRRPPTLFTTVFEAESKKRYLESRLSEQRSKAVFTNIYSANDEEQDISNIFPKDYILNAIRFSDFERLAEGALLSKLEDSITINFHGHSYYLSPIDMSSSHRNAEKIIGLISNSLRAHKFDFTGSYEALKGLLTWNMIIQELPNLRILRALKIMILSMIKHCKESRRIDVFNLLPYAFLMVYQYLKLQDRYSSSDPDLSRLIKTYCTVFWSIFFQYFNILELKDIYSSRLSKENESLLIMKLIHNSQKDWWTGIENAIRSLPHSMDLIDLLDVLYFLACFFGNESNWRCFIVAYEKIPTFELGLTLYNHFIEIVISLIETKGWKIDDELMAILFSTITARKFMNFENERSAHLIGYVHSRQDILPDTFMNAFLFLLYSYISDLPPEGNQKRIMVKFMVSGPIPLTTDKFKKGSLINRLNHTLILLQLSSFDLLSAFGDIVRSVGYCKDIENYKILFQAIQFYIEIVDKKSKRRPLTIISEFLQSLICLYDSMLDATKLWKISIKYYQQTLTPEESLTVIEKLSFGRNSAILQGLSTWMWKSMQEGEIISQNIDNTNFLYRKLVMKFLDVLHIEMMTLEVKRKENRNSELIEQLIKVVVRLELLDPNTNWSLLVFQKFQFLGNQYLREKFSLYFYRQVLNYWTLENLIDSILIAIIQALGRYSQNMHLILIWNFLRATNNLLFQLSHSNVIFTINYHSRENIAEVLFQNLNDSKTISRNAKSNYFNEFLEVINGEFDIYYKSRPFKEYCKSIVKILQKHSFEFIKTSSFKNFTEKLGINEIELRKYELIKVPLREQLELAHTTLVNALHFNRDYVTELKKCIFYENFSVAFQVLDIYIRAIKDSQEKAWVYLMFIIRFILVAFMEMKVQISTQEYVVFVDILSTLPEIPDSTLFEHYQNQCLLLTVDVFNESLIATSGYMEQKIVVEALDTFNEALLTRFCEIENVPQLTNYSLQQVTRAGLPTTHFNDVHDTSDNLDTLLEKKARALRNPYETGQPSKMLPLNITL